jgi:hypothetical protein
MMATRFRLVVFILLALTATRLPVVAAQSESEVNRFVEVVIDSLAIASDAHSLAIKSTTSDTEEMTTTRLAVLKMREAQAAMTPVLGSGDLGKAASALSHVYGALAKHLQDSLAAYEDLVRLEAKAVGGTSVSQELAEVSIRTSRVNAEMDTIGSSCRKSSPSLLT